MIKSVIGRAGREGEHDDADGLLRVIHPVREAHHPRGDQLQFAEPALHLAWTHREPDDNRRQQAHEKDAEREADERREYHGLDELGPQSGRMGVIERAVGQLWDFMPDQPAPEQMGLAKDAAAEATDERMRRTGGDAEPPGDEIPHDASHEAARDGHLGDSGRVVDEAFGDRRGDGGTPESAEKIGAGR